MPARLSSLLVRDGLVGVKRMEKAFQRQVIYGGSLDTILLEMNLIAEERLTQYLALASGLPPAARDEGNNIAQSALAMITAEIAAQFRAVPLSFEGEAVRVLVCSPLEISELEDLADLLDRPLQPLITPEYRWHLVYSKAYRVDAPARFTTLARQLDVDATPLPVGRPKSVIVEAAATDTNLTLPMIAPPVEAPPVNDKPAPVAVAADDMTEKVVYEPPHDVRGRTSTLIGVQPSRASTDTGFGQTPRAPAGELRAPTSGGGVPISTTVTPSSGVPAIVTDSVRAKMPKAKRASSEPIATAGRDSPLAVVRARELLATADDRDTVFLTLLRAARARARYAGLLTVQGGVAIGRLALGEVGIDVTAIQKVLIPLDVVSPFRAVAHNQQPHIGALHTGEQSIDAMVLRLGGTMPPSALLMPIVLRDRVVAIVVAHRGHSDLKLVDVTELLPLGSAAADALGRLIVRHKSAGFRAPVVAAPHVEIEEDRIETNKVVKKDAQWRAPSQAEVPAVPTEPPPAAEPAKPQRRIQEVLDDVERSKEDEGEQFIAEALERPEETLGELAKRFPGKLHIDRFAVAGRPLRAAQYGTLLELVVRLGAASAELLIDRMTSPQRDTRFYATVCVNELRPRNAVFTLVERLFDQDYGVRQLAVEALAGYPKEDLSQALTRARRAVHADDPEIVAAATLAIVQLGDVDAIDDLIDGIVRADRGAEHIRKALVALTAQDFGTSDKKWRKWYEGSRRRNRIEWLIDGLVHKEDAIRELAINDLRRITGEYFGYHHDLPRKEREHAADRWKSWWRESGMRRFGGKEDERTRITAMLPIVRRD